MAMGRIGMTLDDVRRLTFDEFEAIVTEWNRARETDYRDRWERMRMLATITIQPHTRKAIQPRQLLPLPWEKKPRQSVEFNKEESKWRFLEMMKNRKGN